MEKSRRRMYRSQSRSLEGRVKELEAQLEKAEAVVEYYATEFKDGIFINATPSSLSNKAIEYFEDKKEIL